MFSVPAAARTSCWLNAWLAGRASTDDVIAGVADHEAVDFSLVPGEAPLSTALLLAELRRLGITRVSAALPMPGHLIGLGGPASFNQDAIEAGQAILLHGTHLGLIPMQVGSTRRWRGADAAVPSYEPDVATADRGLRDALREATERLVELDVTSWNPDVADALLNLRAPNPVDRPLPFATPRAAQTAISAIRAASIVALADREDSGPVSVAELTRRRAALRPLDVATRVALVAACSATHLP